MSRCCRWQRRITGSGPTVGNMAASTWKAGLASGFRTAGRATSGIRMAVFPGLERKFRRGRPRGKSVCAGERGESPERSRKPLGVRYPGVRAARLRGSRGGGGEWPEGAVQSWDGRARGCARGGRAAARWAVGDPIVGRRLTRVNAPLWAGAIPGAEQQMPP